MNFNIRLLYLYLFSFVGLLIIVIGSVSMVNLGLRTFVFKDADTYENYPMTKEVGDPLPPHIIEEDKARQARETTRQRQRELTNALAMIAVGIPLYLYHWKTIQKEFKAGKKE